MALKEKAKELLKKQIFHFGTNEESYDYFPTHVRGLLNQYLEVLKDKDFWKEFYIVHYPNNQTPLEIESGYEIFNKMIEGFCCKINDSIENYYKANVSQAYKDLSEGLISGTNGILFKTSRLFTEAIEPLPIKSTRFYRIRKKGLRDFKKKDMFHIPYELRGKVSTQRYSIPGHPSLYLGSSIYVCWEELDKPPIHDVYACRFQNIKPLRLIEIIRTSDLLEKIENLNGPSLSSEIFRFILTFPLTIACSIKTKNRDDPFKPEYIIPQLFLQFILEHKQDIDGIKYFSTRIDPNKAIKVPAYNYVLPTTSINRTGYCSNLVEKFEFTEPLLWGNELVATENRNQGFFLGGGDYSAGPMLELTPGRLLPYFWSSFGGIEVILENATMKLTRLEV